MPDETAIKKDLLRIKCDEVLSSMRSRTPLAFKGLAPYVTFQPPPYDMDETSADGATFDSRHWVPLPHSVKLERQALMAKHHFVAEPDWLPPVQTVQHRVPRPRSRGVKLRSVEAIVNDTQRQKALSNEERANYMTARTPPRQQPPAQRPPPPPPKSKVLDFLHEITSVSRTSSASSSKSALTPTQNGTKKSQQQQPHTPNKKPLEPPHPFKKPVSTATPPPPSSTPIVTTSAPRSAPRPTTVTDKLSTKTNEVAKSRPSSSETNLDLFITKQFLINDMTDPAATRHLEDLSRSNVIEKRPILRVRIMLKKKGPTNESKEVIKKSKNDTQSSPVVSGDPFNLPTGTIPTEFIRSMKIRKKSKSDQAAAAAASSSSLPPPSSTHKSAASRSSHMVELEEGETISPSPSPRRPLSTSPDRRKRQRDEASMDEWQKQEARRSKTSKKDMSIALSSSPSSSSSSSTSRHYDTTDEPAKTRRDEDRKPSSSKRSVSGSGGDDHSDSKRRSRRSSSGRSREDDRHHRSSQRSSRARRSSRSPRSRSRSPRRRSSSSSSNTRSSSIEKNRRHTPLTSSSRDTHKPSVKSSTTTTAPSSSGLLNGPGTPKESRRTKDTLGTPKDTLAKDLAPTPTNTTSVPSPAVLAMAKESIKNATTASSSSSLSPAISAIKHSASKANEKHYPPATAENADTPDQYRIFSMMFQKLALAYKRRGDHADTEIAGLLDHTHAFLNYVMAFHFQDRLGNDPSQKNWDTLHPFTNVLLQKLRSPKNKERQDGALYGLCQRMNALVHFYTFSRRERMVKPKVDRLCDPNLDDTTKRLEYSKTLQKTLQDYEVGYQLLRDSDKYMAFEVIQAKFPVSYQNVCVQGQVGAGIVVGGEAGVSVGPMFPLVPHARLDHAAIMAKCILQEFVDKERIDYRTITNTEDYM